MVGGLGKSSFSLTAARIGPMGPIGPIPFDLREARPGSLGAIGEAAARPAEPAGRHQARRVEAGVEARRHRRDPRESPAGP